MTTKYDLYSEDFKKNSYATFKEMRKVDPIIQQLGLDGVTPIWFFSRYEDVNDLLRDKRLVRDEKWARPKEKQYTPSPLEELISNHMLNKDGDDHRRLRNLVSQAFTPKRVQKLEPRIQNLADELIDNVYQEGKMDVIADFSAQLPTIVILEMLGVPLKDRDKLREWSRIFIDLVSQEEFMQAAAAFTQYLRKLFDERRQDPKDDLMSALLQAEEEGDKLSEGELFSTLVLLVVAGHETTMNLVGNAVLALLQDKNKLETLKHHPEMMKDAVEEFLRYDAPVERALFRLVAEDMDYKGFKLKRGEAVILIIGSANRDEAQFTEADKLVLDRQSNPHLSFGKGIHYCLGAPLARLEGAIALNTLIKRLPNLRLAVSPDNLTWRNSPGFKGLKHLPVKWDSI